MTLKMELFAPIREQRNDCDGGKQVSQQHAEGYLRSAS